MYDARKYGFGNVFQTLQDVYAVAKRANAHALMRQCVTLALMPANLPTGTLSKRPAESRKQKTTSCKWMMFVPPYKRCKMKISR